MKEEIKTDYCIIGGGIAGILLASKLATLSKKILILDQGPRFSEEDRANMLEHATEDLNQSVDYNDRVNSDAISPHTSGNIGKQSVNWKALRLFGIGGTALHFNGTMTRPLENDLKVKTLFGYGRDWPISYSELEPWLLKAEYEIGVAGNEDNPYASPRSEPFPMPAHQFSYFDSNIFGPALKKLGIVGHSYPRSVNSIPFKGRSGCLACRACRFCPSGARYSPDRVHVPMLDKQSNVSIIENISTRRLETNSRGDKITAAHAIRLPDKSETTILAKNFIVAMGGVETPRMLLLSADDNLYKNGLGNMGGQLGKGFSDHSIPSVNFNIGKHAGSRLGFPTMITDHFRLHKERTEYPTFAIRASPSLELNPIGKLAVDWATKDKTLSLEELRRQIPQIVTLSAFSELEGKGELELDYDKLDAFGSPVAKISMQMTEWDRRGYTKLNELIPEIGEVMSVKNISEISPPGSGFGYHPSGATAMAKSPDEGVCDENLKVFGLDNLYVVSNSVFPHMGANPPTLTIAALALRLAAHFKGTK